MFLYNVIFHFYVGGGVSGSHVQAQILPAGARKGDEQASGVGGQVVVQGGSDISSICPNIDPNFIEYNISFL